MNVTTAQARFISCCDFSDRLRQRLRVALRDSQPVSSKSEDTAMDATHATGATDDRCCQDCYCYCCLYYFYGVNTVP